MPRLDWTAFDEVSRAFGLLGFNVIPLPPNSKGAQGSGITFRHLNKPGSRRTTPFDRKKWAHTFERKGFTGIVGAYLLPASGQSFGLAIVDVDDPEFDARAVETFGDSPVFVSRGGRVRHRYFRTDNPRRAHLIGAFGKHSVDIISTTGVVLPGSIHADGEAYALNIPFEELDRVELPTLDLSKVDALRTTRRGALKLDLSTSKPVEGCADGFIHVSDPLDFGDSVWCGHVLPSTMIRTVDGPRPLREIAAGTKCFATYRDDRRPSAHVSDYRGRRYFWDMSTAPRRYWTMVEAMDAATDPELENPKRFAEELRERLGLDVEIVDDADGVYLADQVDELPDDSTTFLIAPHGSGKTVFSKREHDRAATSISVCNTQALTLANASVLGLRPVYEGIDDVAPKGSACIPSLHRYHSPPEFFHVDEADAVHGFLHSGKVDDPLEAWRVLAYFSALSKRCLIASADLSFEDLALFTHAIRERNATRRLRVIIRQPTRARARLVVRPVSVVKQAFHEHADERHDAATFVGITTRKLAGQIAQGYRSAGALETIDLDAIDTITSVVDNPRPYPLADVAADIDDGITTEVERPFFVSGENNRFRDSVRWLEDTAALVDAHDLIVTSPAIQSGVSLDRPVSRVFIFHENRDIPADAVLQIARRPRHPENENIFVGVHRWTAQPHRTDRAFLDDLIARRAKTTVRAIAATFPDFEHETETDPEFAWSWRITARKQIRSYADPIGELKRAALRHGWEVDVDLEGEGDPEAFNSIVSAARAHRTTINADEVTRAPDIDPPERDRLERAAMLQDGERQALDKATIRAFYGMDVSPELVILDNSGRYRAKVRAYVHARLVVDAPDVVAHHDRARAKGRQPTELSHAVARAMLLVDLFSVVFDRDFDGETFEFDVHEIRGAVRLWWARNRDRAVTFFPRLKGPSRDREARWITDRLRTLGATIETQGKSTKRRKTVSFERVDAMAEAYAGRLFENFEKEQEREQWKNEIRSSPSTG
jgi:hypothetical protein